MNKLHFIKWMSYWPPFLGAGICVRKINKDYTSIEVEMKLRFWNKNAVGTQFGGSLYSMTDPFFMLMLMKNLGKNYIIWDKEATIRFKKPGKGNVRAHFQLTSEKLNEIRSKAENGEKVEPTFIVSILDESDTVIAEVVKLLYVKKKNG